MGFIGGLSGDNSIDTGTCIDVRYIGGDYGVKLDNVGINNFDVGVRVRRTTYTEFRSVFINSCPSYGFWFDRTSFGDATNTLRIWGGAAINCGYNIYADQPNDLQVFATVLEAPTSSAIFSTQNTHHMTFMGCSFEENNVSGIVMIDEYGHDNQYIASRMESNVEFTAIQLQSGARNIAFTDNTLGFTVISGTCHIIFNNPAGIGGGNVFVGNRRDRNFPGIIDWQLQSGQKNWFFGNEGVVDTVFSGITFGANGVTISDNGSGLVKVTASGGGTKVGIDISEMRVGTIRNSGASAVAFIGAGWNMNEVAITNVGPLSTNSGTVAFNQSGGFTKILGNFLQVNAATTFSGTTNFAGVNLISGTTIIYGLSGINYTGPIVTSGATTGSGGTVPGAAAGWLNIQVSGGSVKVPYFNT